MQFPNLQALDQRKLQILAVSERLAQRMPQ